MVPAESCLRNHLRSHRGTNHDFMAKVFPILPVSLNFVQCYYNVL